MVTATEDARESSQLFDSEDSGMSLLDLLILVANRKRQIFYIALVTGVATFLLTFLLTSQYTAITTIIPPQQSSTSSMALLSQFSQSGSMGGLGSMGSLGASALGIKNPNEIYVAMLKCRTVEDAMVERFDLRKWYGKKLVMDARAAFEKHVQIAVESKSGLIRISVEDSNPARAAEIANGYVAEFRKFSAELAVTEASQRRLFFEQQLKQSKEDLASAEEQLKRAEQTTGLIHLDSQARALIETAAALRAQVTAKRVQIRAMRSFATEDNPLLVQARQQLAELEFQLNKIGGTQPGGDNELLVSRGRIPESGLEYVRKFREVKYHETVFELLAKQYEIAKLDEAREGAVLQVMDKAVPPEKRSFPKRTWIAAIAAGIACLGAVLWIVFSNALGKTDPLVREQFVTLRRALIPSFVTRALRRSPS